MSRTVRINATLDADLLARIDAFAAARLEDRSTAGVAPSRGPVDAAAARHVGQPGDDVARHLRVDLLGEVDEGEAHLAYPPGQVGRVGRRRE